MAEEAKPRYEARWVNGVWVTFDRHTWKHVAVHNCREEAVLDAMGRK